MSKLVFITVLFFYTLNICAQIPKPPVNVPSPNAFQFSKYGNTPVNLFNGQPSIQVPLHSVSVGDINFNASLGYDASGFRPDVFPSWVGQNWNLNIGGVLTRKVRGMPDEFNFTTAVDLTSYGSETFWYPNGYINRRLSNDFSLDNLLKTYGSYYTGSCGGEMYKNSHTLPYIPDQVYYMLPQFSGNMYGTAKKELWPTTNANNLFGPWEANAASSGASGGIQDMYPDEFTFNAMGISGKFYFKKHGPYINGENWNDVFAIQCDKKIRVIPFFDNEDDTSRLKLYQIPLKPYMCGNQATTDQRYMNYSPWARSQRYPKVLSGFTIITEDGVNLTFGRDVLKSATSLSYFNELPIEFSTNLYSCSDYWTADSWYLSSITSSTGKKISLEYERGGFIASKFMSVYDAKINDNLNFLCQDYEHGIAYKSGKAISPVYLKRVYGENFMWTINRSESSQLPMNIDYYQGTISNYVNDYPFDKRYKVDNISFMDNGIEKKINFNYINSSNARLRLGSVTTTDAALKEYEKYQFNYFNDIAEPAYLSNQSDHWGFWNGQASSYPPQTSGNTYYNSREPSFYYAKQGMLSKITYPTGGSTSFVYEPNSCSKEVQVDGTGVDVLTGNKTIGGLRIKEIIDEDGITSVQKRKKYYYINDFNSGMTASQIESSISSGVLNSKIQYRWTNTNSGNSYQYSVGYSGNSCTIANPQSVTSTIDVFSSQPLYYLYDNYHVGYSKVYEVESDNSYSKYEYTNHDNGYTNDGYLYSFNSSFESPFNRCSDKNFERGKLLKQSVYGNNNSLLKEKSIEYIRKLYADYTKNSYTIWEGTVIFSGGCGTVTPYLHGFRFAPFGNQYSFNTYPFLPAHEKEIVYDKDNSLSKIETDVEYVYEGESHFFPTKIKTTNSKGEEITNIRKYAFDYPGEFMMRNIVETKPSTVLENLQLKKDLQTNSQMVIGGQINEYGLSIGSNFPWLNSVYQLRLNKPVEYSTYQNTVPVTRSFNSSTFYTKDLRYEEQSKILKYDVNDNPLEILKSSGEKEIIVMGNKLNNILAIFSPKESETWDRWLYTSFEKYSYNNMNDAYYAGSVEEFDSEKDFEYTGVLSTDAFTGNTSFIGAIKSKDYVHAATITVVAKHGGSVPTLQVAQGNTIYNGALFIKVGETNNWDIYQANHSNGGTKIIINSNGNLIDELRVSGLNRNYFATTFTYRNSLLSTIADKNLKRTFYEYDKLGRLSVVKDDNKNILKRICYNYAGQVEDCGTTTYQSIAKSAVFTRNNCGAGYTGSSVTYTAAAGAYTSTISQTDADQKAQNDVNINGQVYANNNGTCTPASLTFSVTNYSYNTYTVSFDNYATYTFNSFTVHPYANNYILPGITPGTYNITITCQAADCGNNRYALSCGFYGSGQSITFYNVPVSASSCNSLHLNY